MDVLLADLFRDHVDVELAFHEKVRDVVHVIERRVGQESVVQVHARVLRVELDFAQHAARPERPPQDHHPIGVVRGQHVERKVRDVAHDARLGDVGVHGDGVPLRPPVPRAFDDGLLRPAEVGVVRRPRHPETPAHVHDVVRRALRLRQPIDVPLQVLLLVLRLREGVADRAQRDLRRVGTEHRLPDVLPLLFVGVVLVGHVHDHLVRRNLRGGILVAVGERRLLAERRRLAVRVRHAVVFGERMRARHAVVRSKHRQVLEKLAEVLVVHEHVGAQRQFDLAVSQRVHRALHPRLEVKVVVVHVDQHVADRLADQLVAQRADVSVGEAVAAQQPHTNRRVRLQRRDGVGDQVTRFFATVHDQPLDDRLVRLPRDAVPHPRQERHPLCGRGRQHRHGGHFYRLRFS